MHIALPEILKQSGPRKSLKAVKMTSYKNEAKICSVNALKVYK